MYHARSFTRYRLCLGLLVTAAVPYFASNSSTFAQEATAPRVEVRARAIPSPTPTDDTRPKLEHIMREVSGTQITVTKKATVIKLDKQPPVENNNLPELFTKAPGLVVSEQQNPGQFNFSYRGLGNPQESEYTLFLQDGLPLMSEWIGFPTLYYLPLPQTVSEIQLIRGGSSLLYGPEPAPAVNFVTRHPEPGTPWSAYFEGIGGPNDYYSTYAAVQEANGPIELRLDAGYQHSDGQRDNGQYDLFQADGYLGYRPDAHQLLALDFHASRFHGGDPGKLTLAQFNADQDFATTPYNDNWVDRYTAVLRYELEFGDGWLMQAKGWYTHQDIDSRAAGNLTPAAAVFPTVYPTSTTFGYEEFNNGGVDLRFRKKWGDDGIFRGSALTFGGVVYYGEAPFTRYTLNAANTGAGFLYAPRGTTSPLVTLDQDRSADYQSIFAENIFRLGSFHIVPSFRLDHENVEVDSHVAPYTSPPLAANNPNVRDSISADHWVPLWGVGLGNDFGKNNETYFSATSGWRPTRFFDIAGTSRTIPNGEDIPDPFHSLDFELGIHGTPIKGLWYDVGLFWMEFDNRTESTNVAGNVPPGTAGSNVDFIVLNTGSSRHRGFEGEISYDFLAPFQHEWTAPEVDPKASPKDIAEPPHVAPLQLIVFSNIQLLDAEFTDSSLLRPGSTTETLVGNTPNYAPDVLWKGGISFRKDKCFNITLSGIYSSSQFWSDTNAPNPAVPTAANPILVPAEIPSYKVFNLSGEFYVTKNIRLIAGVSNFTDEKYYSRVFLNGLIDPAPRRSGYAGLSVEF